MKIYIVVQYFNYEGYDRPSYAFSDLSKAEAKMVELNKELGSLYGYDQYEILEMNLE